MAHSNDSEIIQTARQLLSGRCQGVLATHSVEYPGYPFGSALPYSLGRNGWPLILVSHLARHTQNLNAVPACSLTITAADNDDIQETARLTSLAVAEPIKEMDKGQLERHFRYFPESREYYEHLSFRFYLLLPQCFYYIAGFGAARWIGVDRMQAVNPFSYAEEEKALQQVNQYLSRNIEFISTIAAKENRISKSSPLLAVGLDPNGLDLRQRKRLIRLPFSTPISSVAEGLQKITQSAN